WLAAPRPIAARTIGWWLVAPRSIAARSITWRLCAPRPIAARPVGGRLAAPRSVAAWPIARRLGAPRPIAPRRARLLVLPRLVVTRWPVERRLLALPRTITRRTRWFPPFPGLISPGRRWRAVLRRPIARRTCRVAIGTLVFIRPRALR